jgi:hypothetical protein
VWRLRVVHKGHGSLDPRSRACRVNEAIS